MKSQNLELMEKDPKIWKGPIYFCKEDSRVFVAKKYPGIGWTLNFGNPIAFLIFVVIIVLPI